MRQYRSVPLVEAAPRLGKRQVGKTSVPKPHASLMVFCTSASWIGRLANGHPLVGHGATRGSAASPSLPGPRAHPAAVVTADVGVREPTRGLQVGSFRIVHS